MSALRLDPKKKYVWRGCGVPEEAFSFCGRDVVIQESFGGGGEAAIIWPAAIIMGRYLEANKDSVVDRNVIELGAGTGLTGIVASLLGAKVTLTDTKEALESTSINVGRNTKKVRHAPKVQQLRWGADLHMYPESDHYDYILGADIIYIEDTFPDLLRTLRHLCDRDTVILLASKIRYPRDERFYSMLRQEYDVRVVKEDREEEVKIYKATLPRRDVAAMPC
ncbi:PREDICTED: protein N-lysine methyltransferase METTL21A-like [Branchiostoma belcheri]|uniref:Protein N-lysine methyltransferase METTL21A-like n=1 Tax=Branchiostoma belcheri TaxID=7741 RepID=A0A6P5AUT1_BRABE|nr:PREDICTED: protein N-lysine methyltransferase METTL21A-like [Branchiostoma belcheri]